MILPCGCRAHATTDTKSIVCIHRVWRVSDLPLGVIPSQTLHTISPSGTSQARKSHWPPLHQYAIDHANDWNEAEARAFYWEWCNAIPDYNCNCSINWALYTAANPPDFTSADAFFAWTVAAHNYVSTTHVKPPKLPMTVADARRLYQPNHAAGNLQHVITWDQFTRDILTLSQIILDRHPDVSAIAGVPRSGMRVASDIAIRLGVPLYEASASNGLRYIGGGSRIRNSNIHGERHTHSGPVVLVDDSVCSGFAMAELGQHADLSRLPKYVVYAASPGKDRVDGYALHLELPHWFDWNILNNGQILRDGNLGIDFDGVLGEDCLPEDDDDGPRYEAWLKALRPIRTPRDYTVPFIITARREAYRQLTEAWLNRYRIQYGQLVMFPGSFAERSQTDIGQWKAEQCDRLGVGLFVESDYWQAKRIAELRNQIVVSIQPAPR
jgi:hypoxanthine phosphoribosyltransferase